MIALTEGGLFAFGCVIFFIVFTAALSLAYLKFNEWEDEGGGASIEVATSGDGA